MDTEDKKLKKTCRICKKTKSIGSFFKDRAYKSGYNSACKNCRKIMYWNCNPTKAHLSYTNVTASIKVIAQTCVCCGETKTAEYYGLNNRNITGLIGTCRDCRNIQNKQRYKKDLSAHNAIMQRRLKNPKHAERSSEYNREQSVKLTDAYIIKQLKKRCSLQKDDIPQELVELKRTQMKFKRSQEANNGIN